MPSQPEDSQRQGLCLLKRQGCGSCDLWNGDWEQLSLVPYLDSGSQTHCLRPRPHLGHAPPTLPTVFAVFSFTSVVDLLIALQEDGYVVGFMDFYNKEVCRGSPGMPPALLPS